MLCREPDAFLVGRSVVVPRFVGLEAAHVEGGFIFDVLGSVKLQIFHDLLVTYRLLSHFLQSHADLVLQTVVARVDWCWVVLRSFGHVGVVGDFAHVGQSDV